VEAAEAVMKVDARSVRLVLEVQEACASFFDRARTLFVQRHRRLVY